MSRPIRETDVWTEVKAKTAPATADLDLEGRYVSDGMVVLVEVFRAMDITTANKTIRLGVKRAGAVTWITREAPGASGYGVNLNRPIYLVGGEAPYARIESATENDACQLVVRGVVVSPGSG